MYLRLCIIAFFIFQSLISAAAIQFKASAPDAVKAGQRFKLTYTMNQKPSGFSLPEMDQFQVVSGPQTSQSRKVSIVNGQINKKTTIKYTYIVKATKGGKHKIPPATASFDGSKKQSNALTIQVAKGQQSQGTPSKKQNQQQQTGDDIDIGNKKLFIRVLISDREVYLGEHLVATVKVYVKPNQVNLRGFTNYKMPDYNGFYQHEIKTGKLKQLNREKINGSIYGTGVLQKMILIPQQNGEIKIDPAEVECVIQKKVRSSSGRNMMEKFFGGRYKNVKTTIKSRPVTVDVQELPSGKPKSFNGAVGQFSLKSSVNKEEVKENETVNYSLTLRGTGNLELTESPEINFPPDFEVYDPEIDLNINTNNATPSGYKTFKYLTIPRNEGTFRIPSVKFSYFNPKTGRYKTLKTEEYQINVNKSKQTQEKGGIIANTQQQEIQYIGEDIHYIKPAPINLHQRGQFILNAPWFYSLYIIPLIGFILFLILRRRKIREQTHIAQAKNRKANKYAKKRLKKAHRSLKRQEEDQFYDDVLKALWGYMSDKLTIPAAELTRDRVKQKLYEYQISNQLIEDFTDLLDHCEYARYAPSKDDLGMRDLYAKAIQTISELERKLK